MGEMVTLWCQAGDHSWTREAQRGRKPFCCPLHAPEPKPSREPSERPTASPVTPQGTVTLYCENGSHSWERPSQRGKRPRNCPDHPNEEPIRLSARDTEQFLAAKENPLPALAKSLSVAPMASQAPRTATAREKGIAAILANRVNCTCPIKPDITDRELMRIPGCCEPRWVCSVLDQIRRTYVDYNR